MKTQNATHTPTPWIQKGRQVQAGEYLADTINPFNGRESKTKMHRLNIRCLHEEDAAFIVRAVNSHDQMIHALKRAYDWLRDPASDVKMQVASDICQAIAQAEGK
jgi:hypothetical protein